MTHNDTKLNNILFDKDTDEGLCIIDLYDIYVKGYLEMAKDVLTPAEIESHMRIMDNVLRYLVVKKEA